MKIRLTVAFLLLIILQNASVYAYTALNDLLNAHKAEGECNDSSICLADYAPYQECLTQGDFPTFYPSYNPPASEPPGVCVKCWKNDHCPFGQLCIDFVCGQCQADADCALASPNGRYCSRSLGGNSCYECSSGSPGKPCIFAEKSRCEYSRCVPCQLDIDCKYVPGGRKTCSGGVCVECTANSNCASNQCDLALKTCVGSTCSGNTMCSGTTPTCSPNVCKSCIADPNVCVSQNAICSSDGSCQQCYLNQHCTSPSASKCSGNTCIICSQHEDCSHLAQQKCLTNSRCVECVASADCTNPLKSYCNQTNNTCQPCTTNSHCILFPVTPQCSSAGCVECSMNSHCTNPLKSKCDLTSHTCQACDSDAQCVHISGTSSCSSTLPGCVECSSDNQCSAPRPICNTTSHSCIECKDNNYCTSPVKPVCDLATFSCQTCISNPDCAKFPSTPKCAAMLGCVGCLVNSDCTNSLSSYCEPGTHSCHLCQADSHCAQFSTKPKCSSALGCVECLVSPDCNDLTKSRCDPNNICKVCKTSSECERFSDTPKCNTTVGCVECISNRDCTVGYLCFKNKCIPPSPLTINLFESEDPDTFIIEFSEAPKTDVNIDVTLLIKIQLLNINSTDYTYQIIKKTDTQFQAIIRPITTLPPSILYLTYTSPSSSQRWSAQILTSRIPFITQEQKEISETMKTVSEATLVGMAALSGSMIILSANPAIFFNLVDTMQSFYYLGSINVKLPPNTQIFMKSFKAGGLEFIPNPIKSWLPSIPTPKSVGRILSESSQSTSSSNLFLANAGNMMFVWIALIVIFFLVILAKMYLGCISRKITTLFNKIFGWLHWSGVLRIILVTYPKLTQAALIQVNSMTFDAVVFIVSAIFGVIFLVFGVLFPLASILIIKRAQKDPELLKTKYKPLIGEFSIEGTMPKYFTVIALLRRLITLSSQVFLHDFPYVQVSLLTAMGVVNILLLAKFRPYAAKSSNVIMIVSELLFTALHVLILIGVHDDQTSVLSDNAKINLGWGMLGCSGLILAVSLEACIVAQVAVLKAVIAALQKKKNQKPALPAKKHEKDIDHPKNSQRKINQGSIHIREDRSEIMEINSLNNSSFTSFITDNSSFSPLQNSRGRIKDPRILRKIQKLKEMNE